MGVALCLQSRVHHRRQEVPVVIAKRRRLVAGITDRRDLARRRVGILCAPACRVHYRPQPIHAVVSEGHFPIFRVLHLRHVACNDVTYFVSDGE